MSRGRLLGDGLSGPETVKKNKHLGCFEPSPWLPACAHQYVPFFEHKPQEGTPSGRGQVDDLNWNLVLPLTSCATLGKSLC